MESKILTLCRDKEIIGIGTGHTIEKIMKYLDKSKKYVPSSIQTTLSLRSYNFDTISPSTVTSLDLYIDGCDYFDKEGNMIKGKGGAFTTEKLLLSMSKEVLILAQDYKYTTTFEECYVPIEVLPNALCYFVNQMENNGVSYCLRQSSTQLYGPVVTDLGNIIFDIKYNKVFLDKVKDICGVVEHGFFNKDCISSLHVDTID